MSLTLITAPVDEPVTVEEFLAHARLDPADTDIDLAELCKAAREAVEDVARRALLTQTWELTLDAFPAETIEVPRPYLQSVTHIKYTDDSGDEQTWSSDEYQVSTASFPGRIQPAYSYWWPSIRTEMDAVRVRYVAGHTSPAGVERELKFAIKAIAAEYFNRAEPTQDMPRGAQIIEVIGPARIESMLHRHRCWTL